MKYGGKEWIAVAQSVRDLEQETTDLVEIFQKFIFLKQYYYEKKYKQLHLNYYGHKTKLWYVAWDYDPNEGWELTTKTYDNPNDAINEAYERLIIDE